MDAIDRFETLTINCSHYTSNKDNLNAVKSLIKDHNYPIKSKIKLILSYSKKSQLDEVPDPYYGAQNGFERVLDLLDEAIDELIDSLIG